ncbi:MAG: carbonate dehydratase [Desulfobacterales bacterium]|nr:carbonate dehydratase [Desulfobacterales bacterium]
MGNLNTLFENNKNWSQQIQLDDPQFFTRLANQQNPKYLWIGCSDSRVPANELVGLMPGEVFVHRNVANLVNHTDFNCLSVIQYAIEALKIEEIIVCGHYRCGGIHEAMENSCKGLVNNWLRHVQDIEFLHKSFLESVDDQTEKYDRLCELNIIEQVRNVCRTTPAGSAWDEEKSLTVHGWIYNLSNGLLHDLGVSVSGKEEIMPVTDRGIEAVYARKERFHG